MRLHSTCQLADGYHWLLAEPDGRIVAVSDVGFLTEEQALADIGIPRLIS